MNHMVEKQMRSAILEIGNVWFSAWVDAGQPALKNLIKIELEPDAKKEDVEKEQKYQKGAIIGSKILKIKRRT